ncbi:hypothetical protein [Vannielia litorea]|uniref:hypothetical protein n=1 Tax=Vannielia litorea TaxID=1217970 RepID=UPI0011151ACA|nr:hypothetical protein [Vannielia litorea]
MILNEVNRLQSLSDWEDVEKNVVREPGSFVGSGELNWPDRSEDRLSNQLATLRELANGNLVPHDFAFNYFYSGDNNIDRTVQEMAANLFEPHAEELRRRLYNLAEDAAELAEAAPASDRMVALDHNSAQFTQAIERLGEVQVKLRENNQIDPDDKARIQVEIVSGIEILKAPKTRVEAAKVMLLGALGWLALEFASSGLGMAAEAAYRAVSTLLGF